MSANREFGSLLREYRRAAGLTQAELARRADVTRHYIASMESGRIGVVYPDVFTKLQRVLGFPGWVLLEAIGYHTGLREREDGADTAAHVQPALLGAIADLTADQQQAVFDLVAATRRLTKVLGTDQQGGNG